MLFSIIIIAASAVAFVAGFFTSRFLLRRAINRLRTECKAISNAMNSVVVSLKAYGIESSTPSAHHLYLKIKNSVLRFHRLTELI